MLLFTREDVGEDGLILQQAIDRQCKLMSVPFAVTPEFLSYLYTISLAIPETVSTENIPPGRYMELQVGRHIEHKYMFRFMF